MRYRKLDARGDYSFGHSATEFYVNTPAAVAQAVLTRLKLIQGEWFLDVTVGTPYGTQILGENTTNTYDLAIQEVILGTQGVTEIVSYSSTFDHQNRKVTVTCTIDTQYSADNVSTITISTVLPL